MKIIIVPKGCMPKVCDNCPYCFGGKEDSAACALTGARFSDGEHKTARAEDCPLIECEEDE